VCVRRSAGENAKEVLFFLEAMIKAWRLRGSGFCGASSELLTFLALRLLVSQ
jgi:hypothetical protein